MICAWKHARAIFVKATGHLLRWIDWQGHGSMGFPGHITDWDRGEGFSLGERGYAGSKFRTLVAVPGYTREIQRKKPIIKSWKMFARIIRTIFGTILDYSTSRERIIFSFIPRWKNRREMLLEIKRTSMLERIPKIDECLAVCGHVKRTKRTSNKDPKTNILCEIESIEQTHQWNRSRRPGAWAAWWCFFSSMGNVSTLKHKPTDC